MNNSKQKIRVLIILDSVNIGGAQTLTYDLCCNLDKNYFDVIFCYWQNKGTLLESFLQSDLECIYLPRRSRIDIRLIRKLRRLLRDRQIDIVHAHDTNVTMHVLFSCLGLPTKIIHSIHGYFDKRFTTGKSKYFHLVCAIIASYLTALTVAVSNVLKDQLLRWGFHKEKTIVVYNGVDPKRLKPIGLNYRQEIGVPEGNFCIGMTGNFSCARDHQTLCEALSIVNQKYGNVSCLFAGNGELLEETKKFCQKLRIENKVSFLGKCDHIADFLTALDCFVYSSRAETFGISVVEAMLKKVPVIVSNIDALLEVLGTNGAGLTFSLGNAKILAEQIIKIIENHELRLKHGEMGYTRAIEEFGIEKHVNQISKIYREIIKN